MQTALTEDIRDTPEGGEADRILRQCVHCGFCTATCPTYQLLGDELDGPRGRIYLIKAMFEGERAGGPTQRHLDRCLTCRACESTCPSGVEYARLLDLGRSYAEQRIPRRWRERLTRWLLRQVLPHRARFAVLLRLGQWLRPLLPESLRRKVPRIDVVKPRPSRSHMRKVLILDGCVQPALAPSINAATARVLDHLGIEVVHTPAAGCCGALSQHLAQTGEALAFARANIEAWWPHIRSGVEAIVITASGCGTMVKEYGYLLRADRLYAEKAARVSTLARDISELLAGEDITPLLNKRRPRIAFHSPCSLQHGQRLGGVTESLLLRLGFELTPVADAHLCCGSAGTYSILQPALAATLRANKLRNLQDGSPAALATANIGCMAFLQEQARVPVRHWIEFVDTQ